MPGQRIPTDKEIAESTRTMITKDLSQVYSVSQLATVAGVQPHTLKRIFKRVYGQSIAEFSLQVRMDKAKELLVTTNNTLQMIAEEIGYTEGNNFQNIFKRVVGVTPGEWRKKIQND